MEPRNPQEIAFLRARYGICIGPNDSTPAAHFMDSQIGLQTMAALLGDAAPTNALQSQLITQGNAGIPAYLVNFFDPKIIEVVTAPMRAVEILFNNEQKKGDWVTKTATFPIVENVGEVSTYGDYNENGLSGANTNFEPRQSYTFQTFTKWGDEELEKMGKAKIDWAARQNIASAYILNKFMNKSYFLGISGLDNYGLLNDPALPPSITPVNGSWGTQTGLLIYADIQALVADMILRNEGNVDTNSKFKLVMSNKAVPAMGTSMQNVYGNATVRALLKETFPNMEIMVAPEYSTSAGELVQLIVDQVQGQGVGYPAFTEKLRAHAIVRLSSSTHQKKSAGTWGTILTYPAGVSSMLGVL